MENNIREDIKNDYGIDLTYGKAWRCREKDLTYVRGTLEASYQKLLSYMFTLKQKNPGKHKFHVLDGDLNGEVDILNKTCTCGVFQITGIPCVYELSEILKRGVNFYSLCSEYYKIETWRSSYTKTIYPYGNEEEWIVHMTSKQ
ncbi:uncharacterized protein LOC133779824 [Humulus lupulus]|uniref:uncharacterized protein LOC133779824 n=1 Tax=Humulus lupulus TaxID=3486 RepID=UPI002B413ED4|nr:uncharacterized protein LOC133779824 [Humulus lupulus]